MSMDYWGIVGYGVSVENIRKYINEEKVNTLVRELNANELFEDDVFDDDTFCGNPYNNFAEFLCELDETDTLTYDDDGNGGSYFLYCPKYPWYIKENDPKSYKDIDESILKSL